MNNQARGAESAECDGSAAQAKELYLDLLKRTLINTIYLEGEELVYYLLRCLRHEAEYEASALRKIQESFPQVHNEYLRSRRVGQFPFRKIPNAGFHHSMIGQLRIDDLHRCLDIVRTDGVVGDFMECGVWRGGACIFMQGYLRVHGMTERRVFVADSFDGLPSPAEPDQLDLSKERFPELAVSQAVVEKNFQLYDVLDHNVCFLTGWFRDTLPEAPIKDLALLRLDGDLYSSTMDVLTHQYDNVIPGGFVIIDDFNGIPECGEAVRDFFDGRSEEVPEYHEIDWTAIRWRRP